jgi:predicted ArsR family transcriptional regulator
MTTRDTSRESYETLARTGALRGQLARVLAAVVSHGPGTSAEIIRSLGTNNINSERARMTELAARGMIVEVGTRKCTVTGRTALVWQYSGRTKPMDAQHRIGTKKLRRLLQRALPHVNGTLSEEIRAALR